MLGVSLILLLMAKDFNCAHGYLFEFRKSGELQFCVSDEAVAFAKKYLDNYKEFTKVDVKDLNGADIPLAKYDCNLVLERGYLPVHLTQKRFEPKFTIPKGQNFAKHFSILAHDSAHFLFTDDPTFAKGLNIVIDGWGVDHISALRYCTKIPPEITVNSYPTCDSTTAFTSNNKVLSQGEKWAHATLKIEQHGSNRNDELTITDKVIYARLVPNSQMKRNSDYYVSFRTNTKGLFKVHTYNVLHSSTVQSSMELLLNEDSSDSLCMDVIFLIRSVEIETSALSLEILDEMRRIQFKKVIKIDRTDEWITERISSRGHTLKRGWAVKLTAHIIEIVIGAVKFCKEGLMVIRPKQAMTNCSSLVNKNIDPTEEKNQLMQLLSELSGCGMFENNCAGVIACGQSGCSCLAGFHGDGCFREIQTAVPQLKYAGTNDITLDVSKSLTGTRNIGRVLIQIKKDSDQQWRDESELHISEETVNYYMIENLRAKTLYNIRFVLFENEPQQDKNFLPGKSLDCMTECRDIVKDDSYLVVQGTKRNTFSISLNVVSSAAKEELCRPMRLTVLYNDVEKKFPLGQTQSWHCGFKPENKSKNRYKNLAAYDSSRVKLELLPGDENSDYINANYVDAYERPKAYIAGQGPTAETIDDFWRMVWQEKVSLIVMLTNLVEGGKKKCEKYWPDVNQEKRHGLISVRTVNEEMTADFVTRALLVSRYDTNRLVQQLHYTSWPGNEVPLYAQSMAMFVEKMFEHKDKNHPILVHSSAGVKRTGTVILIDACLRMVRSHGRIDVVNIFARMRSQRANLIDNLTQYEFAHLVLLEIIANPTFEISCEEFSDEYKKLKANNRKNLKDNFSKLKEICERDFQRVETPVKNETDKCRNPDFISSSNAIVRLSPYENVVTTSFINAVTVDGYQEAKQFIATQVPMKNTVEDFWRMIDQNNVKEIVVLNEPHVSEGDFLPSKERRFTFGKLKIISDDFTEGKKFKTLNVQLKTRGISKSVSVKRAYDWMPGKVTPPNSELLIELWDSLKKTNDKDVITVVCHDGVTASGLFLGIGFVIEKIKLENKVDVGLAVRTLRKSRPAFLSSEVQFGFLYEAARNYLSSFDTYRNFK
ncbi:Hypothetical predicted protein [Cloeon dipterum]|uniref:protein-tyrosine-phosphatase n=1 Tax=Cloeon dipterum TaxID=197152 RepID=A0A8S1CJI7_9INSE|nr:Hypothetical predicted protein [Cloeon dipterum]